MDLKDQIRRHTAGRATEELLAIWKENDRSTYTALAFDVIEETLTERGVELPAQGPPVETPNPQLVTPRRLFGQSAPSQVRVAGEDLSCHVCEHGEFWHRRSQLNTVMMTFLELDWLNRSADCYVCANCGYIHWFLTM